MTWVPILLLGRINEVEAESKITFLVFHTEGIRVVGIVVDKPAAF